MFLTVIAAVLALLSLALGVRYFIVRPRCTAAYRVLREAAGDEIAPARDAYWALDRLHKRLAVGVIVTYAAGMILNMILGQESVFTLTRMLCHVPIVPFFATFLLCMVHNDRETDIRIEADVRRRYS